MHPTFLYARKRIQLKLQGASGYNGHDLRYRGYERIIPQKYKIINIDAVKLDHCDQDLQQFYTAILGSVAFVICIISDITIANYYDYERTFTKFQ